MDQIEWDYRSTLIELRPGDGTAEPFFIHLFRGCVLFESLLKANPKDNRLQPGIHLVAFFNISIPT